MNASPSFPVSSLSALSLLVVMTASLTAAPPSSMGAKACRTTDPRLKTIVIDQVTDEAYLSVKMDTEGRIFVGGRDSLFVFEPTSESKNLTVPEWGPRQRLVRFPDSALITGIETYGNDLYVLTANALYLIPEGRTKRDGLRPHRMLWGIPVDLHVSFHCLAFGPDGNLYLNHGDPLLRYGDFNRPDHWDMWTFFGKDGEENTAAKESSTSLPRQHIGVGSVWKMRPDGTNFRHVADGLRGPVGICFSPDGYLFTNDNDHESRADLYTPARMLDVFAGANFFWPRGWTAHRSPNRSDLLRVMNSDSSRGVPVGLTWLEEPTFPEEYRQSLVQGEWDQGALRRATPLPSGASFSVAPQRIVVGPLDARPMGVSAAEGAILFTRLYLQGNVGSPHCASDLVMVLPSAIDEQKLGPRFDPTVMPTDLLLNELVTASWSRRQEVAKELSRRVEISEQAVQKLTKVDPTSPAFESLLWLATSSHPSSMSLKLDEYVHHSDPAVRVASLRVLANYPELSPHAMVFERALADPDPLVQRAAITPFLEGRLTLPFEAIVSLATSSDTYLRQPACMTLARWASPAQMTSLCQSSVPTQRLAGVLAAGFRLTMPARDFVPPNGFPKEYRPDNAHFVQRYADRPDPVDLRKLGPVGSFTMAELWNESDHTPVQLQLAQLLEARLGDEADTVADQAAYFLSLLGDKQIEPQLAALKERRLQRQSQGLVDRPIQSVLVCGPFPENNGKLAHPHLPETRRIDRSERFAPQGRGEKTLTWNERPVTVSEGVMHLATSARASREPQSSSQSPFGSEGAPASNKRLSSWYAGFQIDSARQGVAQLQVDSELPYLVCLNGRVVARREGSAFKRQLQQAVWLDLRPGSNECLVRLLANAEMPDPAISLRAASDAVVTLPEHSDSQLLAERLKQASSSNPLARELAAVDWEHEVKQGNPAAGERLFSELGCAKCHSVVIDQPGGGAPNLADAGKRFAIGHLVESIMIPGAKVAEPFRATQLVLTDGTLLSGLVSEETSDYLDIRLPDTKLERVPIAEIDERKRSEQSPMPAGLVRSRKELRDLLAYLTGSERTVTPTGATEIISVPGSAGESGHPELFAKSNLVAWCIVPFDGKKRDARARMQMLKRLGIGRLAYDWRAPHLETLDQEFAALKEFDIELTAFWLPISLEPENQPQVRFVLDQLKKHSLKPQLWVLVKMPNPAATPEAQTQAVNSAAKAVGWIADEADKIGCRVALYNHGGWFGEPENQIDVIKAAGRSNVGIVYNLHHGHAHLRRFPELLKTMKPYLMAFNLNGMVADGEKKGQKIHPLGKGTEELDIMERLAASGWFGPIGILHHRDGLDAEAVLKENLAGLYRLLVIMNDQAALRSWNEPDPSQSTMELAPTGLE